jgi:hypothetical protein
VKLFYWKTWFAEQDITKSFADVDPNPINATFQSMNALLFFDLVICYFQYRSINASPAGEVVLKGNAIVSFCQAVKRTVEASEGDRLKAPFDFAIVASWEALCLPLFHPKLNINLLQLVHLNNNFKHLAVTDAQMPYFCELDHLVVSSKITEVWNTATGLRLGMNPFISYYLFV